MGNGILLMFTKFNLRIHTAKADMSSIVFTGSRRIEKLIISCYQSFTPARISPYPVLESIFDSLLFLLRQCGLLFIKHTLLFSVCIFDRVIDTDISQIQCILQNLIGICPAGAVGHIGMNIITARRTLTGNLPFRSHLREFHLNASSQIKRRLKGFFHESLDIISVNPCCTQTNINLRCIQVFRLCLLQCCHINRKQRIILRCQLCNLQFFPDIAGKIFICSLPSCGDLTSIFHRILEYYLMKLCEDRIIFARCAKK